MSRVRKILSGRPEQTIRRCKSPCISLTSHNANSNARPHDWFVIGSPPLSINWVWSPTSGHGYRRDTLLLFSDNPALAVLRAVTYMHFARGIGTLCGSVFTDVPVFAYRIHGRNIFTQPALAAPELYRARRPGRLERF